MSIQKIIEALLRARLYRLDVLIRTQEGASHDVLVREVRYDGSRSFVVVENPQDGRGAFPIPLHSITGVAATHAAPFPGGTRRAG